MYQMRSMKKQKENILKKKRMKISWFHLHEQKELRILNEMRIKRNFLLIGALNLLKIQSSRIIQSSKSNQMQQSLIFLIKVLLTTNMLLQFKKNRKRCHKNLLLKVQKKRLSHLNFHHLKVFHSLKKKLNRTLNRRNQILRKKQ